jgi:hypothetical protein
VRQIEALLVNHEDNKQRQQPFIDDVRDMPAQAQDSRKAS